MTNRIKQSEFYSKHPHILEHLAGLVNVSNTSQLNESLIHMVRLRASQINQCGFCQKMHADEARAAGEKQARLDVLSAWRELDCFTNEERTALEWTEALTLIHSSTISDDIYSKVERVFGKQGLVALTTVILQINSWNRIAISLQFQPEID